MFGFIKKGLGKTIEAIKTVAPKKAKKITKDTLEEILLEADVEYSVVENIIYYLPPSDLVSKADVKRVMLSYFTDMPSLKDEQISPFVEVIVGVNGAGKTTTIAKLAQQYKQNGQSVMLGASDTFRAAAVEQLKRWADKIDVPIVYTQQGHDPSAVAYDTISSAKAKKIERVLIDTAGRLHNQTNLANELKKIVRICDKALTGAPHRKILILDGTQGNSAIAQAKSFHEIVGIDAIIITKLDGTAKGGSLLSVAYELKIPIAFVGVGEKAEDLVPFDKEEFVDSILGAFFEEE
jgi:fused signal recognition particle receptor